MRSRELVYSCGGASSIDHHGTNHYCYHSDNNDDTFRPYSSFSSSLSDTPESSSVSSSDASTTCHPHLLTYLSLRGPPDPADYALLRRSSIRTLSCELLPRGLSSGPLCFGDSDAGYTIAYIFRLPDPMARGRRRSYALVALAGKDAGRAFRACPVIWRAFGRIAAAIVESAKTFQEGQKQNNRDPPPPPSPLNNASASAHRQPYTPVSSFLTSRLVDPDGQPRRPGQIRARNLAEIVGDEYVFAELHGQFAALLQRLGGML